METSPEGNMAPQRSWWSRNWKWAVPVGCLGVLVSCCGIALIAGALGWTTITNNPASTRAVEIAKAHSEVQAALGTPIQVSLRKQQGSVSHRDGRSTARFVISLDGPKAEGDLRIEAIKVNDEWIYQVLQLEVPGQEPIDLRGIAGGPPSQELMPPLAPRQGGPPEVAPGDGVGSDDDDDESDINL